MEKKEKGLAPIETIRDIIGSRKMLKNLAKNDFKGKFAGSYLGIFWAFVQPIITVFLYWFVFETVMGVGPQASTKEGIAAPYVMWLMAGLIPWFYFSDVITSGTNCLMEYSYLVKKVVFQFDALPMVKAISGLFVHVFFVAFMIVFYAVRGYLPTPYMLQVIYYSFCMICLTLGLTYFTSAIVVFFRDLSQIISILLQILIWMTPIMWNFNTMTANMSPVIVFILKLNPMYYIVSGYRDAMINQVWFWEHRNTTIYFWVVTILIFWFGTSIFRRLRVHFADVL